MDDKIGVFICSGYGIAEALDLEALGKVVTEELQVPLNDMQYTNPAVHYIQSFAFRDNNDYSIVLFNLQGKKVWSWSSPDGTQASVTIPAQVEKGLLQVQPVF